MPDVEDEFPKLLADGYTITSQDTPEYNCFAWAMYDTSDWWSPLQSYGYYWPGDRLPRNTKLETFIALYGYEGQFVPCDDGELEQGYEKIALFVHTNGNVTHAARQKSSGVWTSKLGQKEDIEHLILTSLEDAGTGLDDYGRVVQFLKRPIPPPPPPAMSI